MAFDPNVYDETTVTESVTLEISDLEISVFDTVTVVDAGISFAFSGVISVYETVTVTDVPSFQHHWFLKVDPRKQLRYKLKWPVWESDSAMGVELDLDGKAPTRSLEAYCGSVLDAKLPTWSSDIAVSETQMAHGDALGPAFTVVGYFGAIGEGTLPTWTLEVTTSGFDILYLDVIAPGWTLAADMSIEVFLTLAKRIPFWQMDADISAEGLLSLNEERAPYTIDASLLSGVMLDTDSEMPMWQLEASIYSGEMSLDATMPIWVIRDVPGGEEGGGELTDKSRFTDYILRYTRP
jgi:hypothetical protein